MTNSANANGKRLSPRIGGEPGTGRGFMTKRRIMDVLLGDPRAQVLIVDFENEFGVFCRALEGTVVKISADRDGRMNPFEMPGHPRQGGNPTMRERIVVLDASGLGEPLRHNVMMVARAVASDIGNLGESLQQDAVLAIRGISPPATWA